MRITVQGNSRSHNASCTHLNARGFAQATVPTVHVFNPHVGISYSSEDGKEERNVKNYSEGVIQD